MAENRKPTLHHVEAVRLFRRAHRIIPDKLRRMQYALYRLADPVDLALARLGAEAHLAAVNEFELEPIQIVEQLDSQMDGSAKLVFQSQDGARFETVLMRAHTGRTTVCVSTQVGCKAGCTFCATARMGLTRNLTNVEIVEQILIAARLARQENRRLRNVVFMGMGEPLHNEEQLHAAIEVLLDPLGFGFSPKRLTVSTVGVPEAMVRLVDRFPGIQVALSLHSARPDLRAKLMPHTRTHSWEAMHEALRYVATRPATHRRQVVMIEYLMLENVNDGPEDADAMIEYLRGIPVIVNLIPYNAIPFAPNWNPTPRHLRGAFADRLRAAGLFTTIRYSMGSDVRAACGQLVQSIKS